MREIERIKKRDGSVVTFEPEKISRAIVKAFEATIGISDTKVIEEISTTVLETLSERVSNLSETIVVDVEDVQDIVESKLMSLGYFDIAKAYIIYRSEHADQRAELISQKIAKLKKKLAKNDLYVTKRSGKKVLFSLEKIYHTFEIVTKDIKTELDIDKLITQLVGELYDGISTAEIAKALIMVSRGWIEKDPAYSDLAARLLNLKLYREVIGKVRGAKSFDKEYQDAFINGIKEGVKIGKLDKKMLDFDLPALAQSLRTDRDKLLKYLGAQTLYDRYYLQNSETKKVVELPQSFWMRVAMGLSLLEKDKNGIAKKFYEIMSTLRYIPSTPTLFHAGTTRPQLSSCYLNTVSDSLDHIFKVISDNAQLSKWSGGIGTDWTYLRATGALIKGIGVESQGVIPFLKVSNDATHAINRSGRRRGAACAYMEPWHLDFESFIELRKNTGDERRRTHDLDTAAWIPDLFMKRIKSDSVWTLFSPDQTPDLHDLYGQQFEKRYLYYEKEAKAGRIALFKEVRAAELWRKMLAMLFETGHPWITFKDAANLRSPQDQAGVIHSSNLCTEITLNTSETETAVCNLGSINLPMHFEKNNLQEELIKESVTTAMRMLDNVIDLNFYPIKEAKNSNLKHRPVGLGLMGLQDVLYLKGINFDSDDAVRFSDQSMEMISYYAYLASANLAAERGRYKSFAASKWDRGILPVDTLDLLEKDRGVKIDVDRSGKFDWSLVRKTIKQSGLRNSNILAIAPTATISNIAGSVPSIEPIYKNIYVKSNASGDFLIINPYMVNDLKKIGLWDENMLKKIKYHDGSIRLINEIPKEIREKYKEVFEIDPVWLIKQAAYRGKWIDQSQSLNIYFIGSSGKQLSEIYFLAWKLGLKTTYYLRTLAASQVEKSTINTSEFGVTHQREKNHSEAVIEDKTDVVSEAEPVKAMCYINDPTCESCQ